MAEGAPTETRSTCPYCGVGCGVIIETRGGAISGVRGDPDHPANRGRLCTKGSTLHLTAAASVQRQVRALQPMRRAHRAAALAPVGWSDALDEVATRLAATVHAHGPDAVGLYLSGQLLTEDYHVFNKLARAVLGTNNVDSNSRLCMSSAVAGYKASLGADAPPACYEDIDLARTLFITGSNLAWAHPVLMRRVEDARRARSDLKIVVVDPRRTETAACADLHLQLLPGTDVALHHGLLHVMLWEGWVDGAFIERHTSGFEALRAAVRECTPAHTARVCGLREQDVVLAARWFAQHGPTLSLYCQGLNQSSSGTDKNGTLINLHLATAQIGRPGAGPFSLTGQPNAMGGREVGALCNLLPGHRSADSAEDRAEVARLWGVRELPAAPGRSAVEMFQAAADGEVKALWIVGTNPASSLPDQAMVRRAFERAEFVIVQEACRNTATAAFADLLLPATTWGEKEGTVTNSERCISRVRAAVAPPGQARHDWRIGVDVARRLEWRLPSRRLAGHEHESIFPFPYDSTEQIWCEHREATRGRDLDITGLAWADLDTPRTWPCATAGDSRARLYGDGRFATPDGRARFTAARWRNVAEPRDARFPVALNTGRLRDQWHGMSRTGTLARLFAHGGEAALEMHPQDLARGGWREGDLARVESRRGACVLPVRASDAVAPTQAFVAMHWGPEWVGALGVNVLTSPALCPHSKQPEFKHAAVRVQPAALPWRLVAAAWLPEGEALRVLTRLRDLFAHFSFVSAVPFGREPAARVGVLLRAAAVRAPVTDVLDDIERALGLGDARPMRYADVHAGQRRVMLLGADDALQGFMLAGDAAAQRWVLDLLQQGLPAAQFGRALLAASSRPPQALAPRSAQVCACLDVSEEAIVAAAPACAGRPDERLAALQRGLGCGTQCGSCLPALKGLLQRYPERAVQAV